MFKTMFFLYRKPDLDADAFRRYSEEVHVPLVSRVPGLKQYVINYTALNPAASNGACDAVAELWFESPEGFQAALETPGGAAALEDQPNYLDMTRTHVLFVDERSVI